MKKYEIIDAHCHIYPEKIAAKAVKATDNFYGVGSHGKGTVADLAKRSKKAGVDHAIVQSVATTPKQVESINRFIAKEVAESNGFLTGLGTLHPDTIDLEEDILLIKELGLKGVKLHPDIQNFKMDTERLFEMYDICQREGLVMLIHTGDKRYDNSNPNRVENVLKSFPKLKVIGAHFGGWSVWEEASKRLCKFENFYVDSSSSFGFAKKSIIKDALFAYGADKVLFASDYPMWSAKKEIKNLLSLKLSETDYIKIFSQNAKNLFGI